MKQTAINDTRFDSPVYKRSRNAYCLQCTFEYFVSILVSDAYLAKLLTELGLSDMMIGIIGSLASVAFLFQLFSVFVVQNLSNTKRFVVIFNTSSLVLHTLIYFIPFLPLSLPLRTALVIICFLFAYIGQYIAASILYKWANSYVHPSKRASYSAGKEMISLLSGMIFTFVVGQIIDRFEALDRINAGFLFIAIAGLILSVCNFICLMLIQKDTQPDSKTKASVPLRKVMHELFGNKNFLHVILLTCLFNMSTAISVGFMGTFKTKDLLLTVGTVQIINIGANLCRVFISKPLGKFSDRTSYARGMELALCISAVGFAINMFTTPKTWWCIILYTVFYNVSIAGTNQNSNNIVYSYVPTEYFVQASAIKNSIGGVVSFLTALVGARILSVVQGNGNSLFGIPMYGQQFLSALSLIIVIGTALYVHFVLAKKSVMHQ